MNRKLKALGLALAATLALSAIGATALQANENEEGHIVSGDTTTGEHVTSLVTATDDVVADPFEFTNPEGEPVTCESDVFHGTIGGGTTKSLTIEPTFGNNQDCVAAGLPATVDNNDCHLTFDRAETDLADTWKVTTDLTCPNSNGIEVNVYAGENHGFQVCTITVPSQQNLEGVVIHNDPNSPDHLTLTAEDVKLAETESGLCGHGEGTATFHGEATVEARNHETEAPVDLWIEHTEP